MKRSAYWIIACVAAAGSACSGGNEPQQPVVDRDGGVVDNTPRDGGPVAPPNTDVYVQGNVYRLDAYLEGQRVALGNAAIRALGVVGVDPVAADPTGSYRISVPQNGAVILGASRPDYMQSFVQLTVGNQDVEHDFLMAWENHIDRLATAFGVDNWQEAHPCRTPLMGQCRYVVVMGRIVDDGTEGNGTPAPIGGVAYDDFAFDVNGETGWYKKGPYFFFFNGQPNANVMETQRQRDQQTQQYRGGLFAYFIDYPETGYESVDVTISASSYAGGPATRYFGPTTVKAYRSSFSWVTVGETGIAPPPPDDPPPPPPQDVDFDTQIYPLLATIPEGGFGCLGCHTSKDGAAPAGGMDFYGGPAAAYAALDPAQYPNRVNVQNPGASTLLTKPLYEVDGNQDHPIFAFVNEQEPAYIQIYGWIQGGAQRNDVPVLPPVSFYNEVRPLLYANTAQGGAGCYTCHVDGVDAATAPGGAYFGGDGNALYDVLVNQPPSNPGPTNEAYRINKQGETGYSLVLTNPTQGNNEPHPAKLFFNANDPRYQTIYRWIAEGYVNDTP